MNDVYLVTGATGFVGSNLVRDLIKNRKKVVVISRAPIKNSIIADISDKLTFYTLDLQNKNLRALTDKIKPSIIFHLAAYGTRPDQTNNEEIVKTNILGTINLLEALSQNPFSLFINTGSSSEYGIKRKPIKETDIPEPIIDYGIAKLAQTLYCRKEAIRKNLPIITFRLFTPYGPYESKERLMPSIIHSILNSNPIVLSRKENVRDFVYIDDVISAYRTAQNHTFKPGEVYNIGSGLQHSVKQVLDAILILTGKKVPIVWHKIRREIQIEPTIWQAVIEKAYAEFGWKPNYTLTSGLTETIAWFESHASFYEK